MFSSNLLISVVTLVLASRTTSAQPRPGPPTDVQILNYALTLEHLEHAFYDGALAKFDEKSFSSAGLNRSLIQQIAGHESDHVSFLSSALGNQATKPCNYSFPYTDVKGFAALALIIEGVGVSAYLGAAAYITHKDYLTAAGSILTTESRHAAYLSSVPTNDQAPWNTGFDTPLDLNQVYSLAAPFITSCPSTNPPLPVKGFPALNLTTPSYTAGSTLGIATAAATTSSAKNGTALYVAFLTGLNTTYVPYNATSKSVVVPAHFARVGTVYAVLTSANSSGGAVTDDTTLAGPAVLVFPSSGAAGETSAAGVAKAKAAANGSAGTRAAPISLLLAGVVLATL